MSKKVTDILASIGKPAESATPDGDPRLSTDPQARTAAQDKADADRAALDAERQKTGGQIPSPGRIVLISAMGDTFPAIVSRVHPDTRQILAFAFNPAFSIPQRMTARYSETPDETRGAPYPTWKWPPRV